LSAMMETSRTNASVAEVLSSGMPCFVRATWESSAH
jgi:hypothetical protein